MMNAMTTLVGTASRGCWQQQALRRSVARRTMSTTTKAGMGKRELIAAVGEKAGLDGKQAESAVKAFLETVTSTVAEGTKVTIPGFGVFEPRARAARLGRNPKTGEELQIAATVVPAFSAGKSFKDAVREGHS